LCGCIILKGSSGIGGTSDMLKDENILL